MNSRTLIIGDIHGSCNALEQLLERAAVTEADRLIFLGDYVDGWSQSCQVIDRLISLQASNSCIFVRGNHDTWCEAWLENGSSNDTWLFHGGAATIKSYEGAGKAKRQEHLAFFNRLVNYHVDAQNNLFIHAGYSSMHGPEKEMYAANYSWDRTLWEMALTMDQRIAIDSKLYPKRLKLFNAIYIGHTPTLNYDVETPMNAVNVWNVDTGAAFYGRLSALDLATKACWQSDIVQHLHPGEKGRNND